MKNKVMNADIDIECPKCDEGIVNFYTSGEKGNTQESYCNECNKTFKTQIEIKIVKPLRLTKGL